MNQSKSLHNLLEVADLIAMVEDLSDPGRLQESSPATLAGMRITLRNARERILESHAQLSREMVSSARRTEGHATARTTKSADGTKILTTDDQLTRGPSQQRDLKATLERFVDRG